MKKKLVLFLVIISAVLLVGCGAGSDSGESVTVYNWGEYIDEGLLDEFEDETGIRVNYKTYETNEQLYSVLRQGGSSFDVIIPSDYMASRLIEEDMVEELDFENIPNLSLIDQEHLGLAYDPEGKHTIPYMWGTVGLIYNRAIIVDEIDSWSALFNPEYSGQVLMFDNSRDAMGIALKYLGYSQNTTDETQLDEAFSLLVEQKPILQAYVMDQIYDKLESGEAAIGPYYAGDYITMREANPDLCFVIPKEGSNRFVDVMCIPKGAKNKENAEAFINFMCSTDASMRNADYIGYTSPNKEVRELMELDTEEEAIMYPSDEVLDRCEFFINLPQDILTLYDDYWTTLKS